jgi:hypothetical protein
MSLESKIRDLPDKGTHPFFLKYWRTRAKVFGNLTSC